MTESDQHRSPEDPPTAPTAPSAPAASTGAPAPTLDPEKPQPSKQRTRRALAATLVVIGAIMGPVAIAGVWARAMVNNTDTYVNAVAPLATDPAVTAALEDRVTDAVMNGIENLDLGTQVQDFLTGHGVPDRLANLLTSALGGLNSEIRDLVSRTVTAIVEDPRFGTAWTAINRTAHQALVAVVDGDSKLLDPQGNLALQLQTVIDAVKQRLLDNGHSWASLLPSNTTAEFVIVPADQVNTLRDTVDALRTVAIVLVIAELIVIVGAVLVAPDRLRGLTWMAFGLAAGAVIVLGALRYAERAVVNNHPQLQNPDAVLAFFQTVTTSLVNWLRLLFVVGLALAGLAALLGKGSRATRARAGLSTFRAKMTNPPYSTPRRIAAGVVGLLCALALVFVDGLSSLSVSVLLFVVLVAGVLALIPGARVPLAGAGTEVRPEGESGPTGAAGEPVLTAAGPGPITPLTAPLPLPAENEQGGR